MDKIDVTVDRYKITDGKNRIYLVVNRNKVMITPGNSLTKQTFNFTLSTVETVRAIANLMLKAADV
ncbi:MAG TPA: hypothetical protein VMV86_04375, partial [Methanosarcinales archaeon]|nr:hypothetical protein [Methanosarcinales archaeon]